MSNKIETRPRRRIYALIAVLGGAIILAACGSSYAEDLEVGDCFNDPTETEVLTVETVDCAEPHDNEVYDVANIGGDFGLDYPGSEAMDDYAFDACHESFEAFVGMSYAESALDITYLTPTEGSWDDGDREIICALYRVDLVKMTGSMKGAGI